ncbi:MAG: energy-coupling factor transporter transmembrane component T family protein [Treponemataceae bacterium]
MQEKIKSSKNLPTIEQKFSFFSYKQGNSLLHRCPSWIKIIFIPFINILFLILPYEFSLVLVVLQFIVAFSLHFSIKEQLTDLKPVLYYGILLFFSRVFTIFFDKSLSFSQVFNWKNEKEILTIFVKLFAAMQSSSLVFKTSTSLELRDGIRSIESNVRKFLRLSKENPFTEIVFLFLNFIPLVSKIWEQSKKSWFVRGGKIGIRMYLYLIPVLFFVGMKKAWNISRAISARR